MPIRKLTPIETEVLTCLTTVDMNSDGAMLDTIRADVFRPMYTKIKPPPGEISLSFNDRIDGRNRPVKAAICSLKKLFGQEHLLSWNVKGCKRGEGRRYALSKELYHWVQDYFKDREPLEAA